MASHRSMRDDGCIARRAVARRRFHLTPALRAPVSKDSNQTRALQSSIRPAWSCAPGQQPQCGNQFGETTLKVRVANEPEDRAEVVRVLIDQAASLVGVLAACEQPTAMNRAA
jgi:hypothetical protein